MNKKSVMIVDDHPIMRQGLSFLINQQKDMKVTHEATDASEAFNMLQKNPPDIAIIDITLPGRSGLDLIKDIHGVFPELPLLAHSMHGEHIYAERVLRAGGKGYIMKDQGGMKVVEALRSLLAGNVYFSKEISTKILLALSNHNQPGSIVDSLSNRQLEIFQLVGHGKSSREIAEQLNLSIKTVDAHRANIKERLGLSSGHELVHHAVSWVERKGDQ